MKINLYISIGCATAVALLLAACTHPTPEKAAAAGKLNPAQLKTLIDQEKKLFFLDVRTPEEIAELGTLPGYVNIPIDQLEQRLAELPRDIPIVTA